MKRKTLFLDLIIDFHLKILIKVMLIKKKKN